MSSFTDLNITPYLYIMNTNNNSTNTHAIFSLLFSPHLRLKIATTNNTIIPIEIKIVHTVNIINLLTFLFIYVGKLYNNPTNNLNNWNFWVTFLLPNMFIGPNRYPFLTVDLYVVRHAIS